MTKYTNDGFDWLADRNVGDEREPITKLAVGTGTGVESAKSTKLSQPVYASLEQYQNVSIQRVEQYPGRIKFILAIKGGNEVTGGTKITEMGIFVNGPTSGDHEVDENDTMIARDTFSPVEIPSGHYVERTLTIDYN